MTALQEIKLMSITFYMLQIPIVYLFLLLLGLGGFFTGLSTYLYRRFISIKVLRSHNEVTGFFFLAIASFYGLLLSFVVFVVFGQLNAIQGNVSKEGSSAMGLYRDIKFYPDTTESKQLMRVYLDFVSNVIDDEFPNMEQMKLSRKTPESFNGVFYKMEHLHPKNSFEIQLVSEMFNHLNELNTYRGLRTASIDTEIPPFMWLPILLGALVTLICALLLDIESRRVHIFLNTIFGGFICMFFFIIIMLDHPYTGALGIKPKAYKEIFTMEKWLNESHALKPMPLNTIKKTK